MADTARKMKSKTRPEADVNEGAARILAKELGISLEAARKIGADARADGKKLPDGSILTI